MENAAKPAAPKTPALTPARRPIKPPVIPPAYVPFFQSDLPRLCELEIDMHYTHVLSFIIFYKGQK